MTDVGYCLGHRPQPSAEGGTRWKRVSQVGKLGKHPRFVLYSHFDGIKGDIERQ